MNLVSFASTVYPTARYECGHRALSQVVSACRQLERQQGHSLDVADLCEAMILDHLRDMRERHLAAASINRRRGHLLTLWKLAAKHKLNDHDYWRADIPTVRLPSRRPVAWSMSHIQVMLEQAANVKTQVRRPFGPRCWRALILLLYYTGLRVTAVLSLKRTDLKGHLLLVPDDIQKDKQEMAFTLPNNLVNMLLSLPRPCTEMNGRIPGDYLIPWPWRVDAGAKMFAKYILRPAGLPDDRRLKFHAIRRTVATLVAHHRGKEAARDIMGHSSLSVTERYLADPSTVDPSLPAALSPQDVLPVLYAG